MKLTYVIKAPSISPEELKGMVHRIDHMGKLVNNFHDAADDVVQRWVRHTGFSTRIMPEPETGDKLPLGLIIPVVVDCFADGFLIGVSCAVSPKAGIVLGFANCLEMSFLGMGYAARLKRCTGSSRCARYVALYGPPLIMFLSSGFGAFVAVLSLQTPAIFISFVAFGAVALVALVCGELIIEARESQGDEEVWYVSLCLYLGIYLVLMLSHAI